MVPHARKLAAKNGVDLSVQVDDMRSFKSQQRFDVVTSLLDGAFTNRADVFEVNRSDFDESSAVNTTVTTTFVRQPGGQLFRRYTEIHKERAYSTGVLRRLLEEAGFLVERTCGLPDSVDGAPQKLEPAQDDAGRVIMVARKAASE